MAATLGCQGPQLTACVAHKSFCLAHEAPSPFPPRAPSSRPSIRPPPPPGQTGAGVLSRGDSDPGQASCAKSGGCSDPWPAGLRRRVPVGILGGAYLYLGNGWAYLRRDAGVEDGPTTMAPAVAQVDQHAPTPHMASGRRRQHCFLVRPSMQRAPPPPLAHPTHLMPAGGHRMSRPMWRTSLPPGHAACGCRAASAARLRRRRLPAPASRWWRTAASWWITGGPWQPALASCEAASAATADDTSV